MVLDIDEFNVKTTNNLFMKDKFVLLSKIQQVLK